MTGRAVLALVAGAFVVAGLVAPAGLAQKPTMERITIDDVFEEQFLSQACGFPVTAHAQGHVIVRTFDRDRTGPLAVVTINIAVTVTANGGTYRFRDVGADILRRTAGGEELLMIIGQIPFGLAGVLKVNLTTGEVVHEPRRTLEGRLAEACAALNP